MLYFREERRSLGLGLISWGEFYGIFILFFTIKVGMEEDKLLQHSTTATYVLVTGEVELEEE